MTAEGGAAKLDERLEDYAETLDGVSSFPPIARALREAAARVAGFARAASPENVIAALDESNTARYQALSRARDYEMQARNALKLAREVYGWAVHEPNSRRLRERIAEIEAQLREGRA